MSKKNELWLYVFRNLDAQVHEALDGLLAQPHPPPWFGAWIPEMKHRLETTRNGNIVIRWDTLVMPILGRDVQSFDAAAAAVADGHAGRLIVLRRRGRWTVPKRVWRDMLDHPQTRAA